MRKMKTMPKTVEFMGKPINCISASQTTSGDAPAEKVFRAVKLGTT